MLLSFSIDVNAENKAHQPHREQNTADTKRISHGIAHPHLVYNICWRPQIAQNLLPRPQRRRIGDRAGEYPQHHRKGNGKNLMQDRGDQSPYDDNQYGKQIQPQSGNAQ